MQTKYCEHGHILLGDTCSHCARRHRLAIAVRRAKATAGTGPNGTLTELRALKRMLEQALITEVEYDERRNFILASF
ncbi:hypothetical protein Q5H92_11290 [Hymenobacter sp. M29]|uniref:SHOCT domain-containing protein n=1 Tax=Hymenobacter mellowenesis TaxID=3063995 RepID=A0ABT9AAT6_9BACT|nr:hypothetical protein [Hymenobacter sp. M29]MDO7846944.1 hypothetical protein [Hymenobacter sp. M29]